MWSLNKPRNIEKTGDDRPVDTLLEYVWRMSGKHQIFICLIAAIVGALSMAPLELQRRIVNTAVEQGDLVLLLNLGAVFAGVLVLQGGLKFFLRMYQGWLSESAIRYCRGHLASLRNESQSNNGENGSRIAVITAEVDKLGGFVGEGLSQPIVNSGMLIAIAIYMLIVDPLVAGLSFLFLIPQAVLVPVVQKWINALIEKRLSLIRNLSDSLSNDQDESGAGKEYTLMDSVFSNRMKTFLLKFAMKAIINFLNAMAPLTVLVVGGYFVVQGETEIGIVVAFMSGFDKLSDPVRELISFYRIAAQAAVQHRMIAKWM
ncbi:MAG: ABC transporter ATP-binding protein [Alphaproteobacteria bacterium]